MRALTSIVILPMLIACFSGCSKDDDDNKQITGPEVEWVSGGTTITYTYSGGVVSGYYFHRSFKVLNESGEVSIRVQVEGDASTQVSKTLSVEKDSTYALKVKGDKSGSQPASPADHCLTVVFSSPSCTSSAKINVGTYVVSVGGIDNYYCPGSLSFGDISLAVSGKR